MSNAPVASGESQVARCIDAIGTVLRGNRAAVELVLASVLARGHVLIEDVPGVGKTTLARAAARVLGCSFSRIQFTSDMLPSDVLGVQVLDQATGALSFRRGPLFANIVLADEINRASPKTQSAMLEAMADSQVSVDDQTFALTQPFIVLATQNPVEHHGAYPLPESQLDRFMVRLSLGYPPIQDERALLLAPREHAGAVEHLAALLDPARVIALQVAVDSIRLAPALADYILAVVGATRSHPEIHLGCSPRGAVAFAAAARALAFIRGRDFVLPDDIKELAAPVLAHRLVVAGRAGAPARDYAASLVATILAQTPVPR